jgi:tetratricopeptide (TPR) repeat protein
MIKSRLFIFPILAVSFIANAFAEKTFYKCKDRYGRYFYNYEAEPKTKKLSIKCQKISRLSDEDLYDAEKVKASNLLASKKYNEAYREYINLLKQNPEDNDVVMGLAISAEKSGHNNQAVMAYEILQERIPDDDVVLSGLARNQEVLGDKASAKVVKDKVRDDSVIAKKPVLPPPVIVPEPQKKKSQAVKKEQKVAVVTPQAPKIAPEKKEKTLFVHGNFNTGVMYDTNVNMSPDTDNLNLGGWSIVIPGTEERDTFASFVGAGLSITKKIAGNYWFVSDFNGNVRWNENSELDESKNRATHYAQAAAGVRYFGTKTVTDVKLKTEVFDYELWQRMYATGINALFSYAKASNLLFTTVMVLDHRSYSTKDGRDGFHFNLGQYVKYTMNNKKYSITISGAVEHQDSQRNEFNNKYGYDGWRTGFVFSAKTSSKFEVSPFINVARDFYFSPATMLENYKRQDNKVVIGTSVIYNLTDMWTINASYSYTDNYSNSELYRFDKHLIQVGTRYEF